LRTSSAFRSASTRQCSPGSPRCGKSLRTPDPQSHGALEARSLSLVASGGRTLDLVCPSPESFSSWRDGLYLLIFLSRARSEAHDVRFLRKAWTDASAGEARLSYSPVKTLLRTLGLFPSKDAFRAAFVQLTAEAEPAGARWSSRFKRRALDFDAFLRLLDMLRDRPDLAAVFHALL
jgi:hypothetical protein